MWYVLVSLVHLTVMAFLIFGSLPTYEIRLMYLFHALSVFVVIVHWITNDNTCALTQLEAWTRGIPVENAFLFPCVARVYAPPGSYTFLSYSILILSGLYSLSRYLA